LKKTIQQSGAVIVIGGVIVGLMMSPSCAPGIFGDEEPERNGGRFTTTIVKTESTAESKPSCLSSVLPLPDYRCTTGVRDPSITQDNIDETICKPGWIDAVRPTKEESVPVLVESLARYGYTNAAPEDFQLDRLIPVILGGSLWDEGNLFPQPHAGVAGMSETSGSEAKDAVDRRLNAEVCSGKITLEDAQHAIVENWLGAEKKLGLG
jgi:hypothetical protein